MKWYNETGDEEYQPLKIELKGLEADKPKIIKSTTSPLTTPQSSSKFNVDSLTQILTTGVKVAGTIAGQRAASGAAAQRQARVAACGRKGVGFFLSRKKREEYRKCVEAANSATYGDGSDKSYMPPPAPEQKSNTLLFVGIGAVVVLGAVAYFVMRKK